MGLEEQLLQDMKSALKSGDKPTLETIRMLRAQLKNKYIEKGEDLSETEVVDVLSKEAKKRKESIDMYKQGERDDLADKESRELEIINSYLPKFLSEDEVEKIIRCAIDETKAESIREMGKVMGIVMPQVKGRADGRIVQDMVKKLLS
jgi:uncharacterized protein YqeY